VRKAPEPTLTVDLATRPRVGMELPAYTPGSFTATQPSLEVAEAKAEAARCFRCDAIYRCASVHVQSGRGPRDGPGDGPRAGKTPPIQPPLAGPASNPPLTTGGRD
jgi:hypothetical protein